MDTQHSVELASNVTWLTWLLYGGARLASIWHATRPTRRFLRTQLAVRFGPPHVPWGWIAWGALYVLLSVVMIVLGRVARQSDDDDDDDAESSEQRGPSASTVRRLKREVVYLEVAKSGARLVGVSVVRYVFFYLASALEMAHGQRTRHDPHLYEALIYTNEFFHRFVDLVALAFVLRETLPSLDEESPLGRALFRFTAAYDPLTTVPLSVLACAGAFVVHWKCYPRRGAWAVNPAGDFIPEMLLWTALMTLGFAFVCAVLTFGARVVMFMCWWRARRSARELRTD